jgi:hypothetical protein
VHLPVNITGCEAVPSSVLSGGMVDAAQEVSFRGTLKTLAAICLGQVIGHNLGIARFYNDSALFGFSYLATLVLSHVCPDPIQVAQMLDDICHPRNLLEALPLEWKEVENFGVKTLQENRLGGQVAGKDRENLHLSTYPMYRLAFQWLDHHTPSLGQLRHGTQLEAESPFEEQGDTRDESATVEISQNARVRSDHIQPPRTTEQRALRRGFDEFVPKLPFLFGQIAERFTLPYARWVLELINRDRVRDFGFV